MVKYALFLAGLFLLNAIISEYLSQTGRKRKAILITHGVEALAFLLVFGLFLTLLTNVKNIFF